MSQEKLTFKPITLKDTKELLKEFYVNLHPDSSDAQFEKFIMRIRREVIYNTAWAIMSNGQTMVNTFTVRDFLLQEARKNTLPTEQNQP